ncbi:COX15/CtaA family protein [Corynebacterium ciconiae]|uniref:COX15/CtaA family protein n=1 Tax=Corynebacterium ciconiae TaxID=227319 RepID=UPI00059008A1|nr:COX15/CtaA family protein [Corynebacterium ciconiae]
MGLSKVSPAVTTQRLLALCTLIAQGGITVTGSIVRVTGSGLGCNTWPQCHEGSFVPVAGAAPWIQQAIEFGNRLLTFVLILFAGMLLLSVLSAGRRKEIRNLALVQVFGILLQAIIGGISVLINLQWWSVALHFIPSILLVFFAGVLFVRIQEPDTGTLTFNYPAALRGLAAGAAVALLITVVTGTMVTGAGVHSGDADIHPEDRLQVDIVEMANMHAHAMYLYLGLTIGLAVALVAVKAQLKIIKLGFWLVAMIALQGAIGIIQYNWSIPAWTVPVHVGMSSVCTALTAVVYAHYARRQGSALVTGSPSGDEKRTIIQEQRSDKAAEA